MKKIILKIVSLVVAVVIMAATLVGCGDNQNNESLTVYTSHSDTASYSILDSAIQKFKLNFENVELNIVDLSDMSDEEYNTKLSADMLSGNGPDIIMMDRSFFQQKDVYKMMNSGVFADINKLIAEDKEFKIEMFNLNILKAGKVDDKQYIFPLYYDVPVMLTTQNLLDKNGLFKENYVNYTNFTDEIKKNIENDVISSKDDLFSYHDVIGIDFLDYRNQEEIMSSSNTRPLIDFYKSMYNSGHSENKTKGDSLGRWYEQQNSKKYAFELYGLNSSNDSYANLTFDVAAISEYDNPIMIPLYNESNTINSKINMAVGIKRDSKSLKMAFEFIKIMSESDLQAKYSDGIPTNIDSFGVQIRQCSSIEYGDGLTSAMYYVSANYKNENGENKKISIPNEIDLIPQETYLKFFDEYSSINSKVSSAYFPTPISSKMYEYFIPYYKDEMSYEECLGQAKQQLQIYISE